MSTFQDINIRTEVQSLLALYNVSSYYKNYDPHTMQDPLREILMDTTGEHGEAAQKFQQFLEERLPVGDLTGVVARAVTANVFRELERTDGPTPPMEDPTA